MPEEDTRRIISISAKEFTELYRISASIHSCGIML